MLFGRWSYWRQLGNPRALLHFKRDKSPRSAANCLDANVFGHALGPDAGVWEIRADNVKGNYSFAQLHEEFQTIVSHDDKVTWLQAYDATYKAQLHDGPVSQLGWLYGALISQTLNKITDKVKGHRYPGQRFMILIVLRPCRIKYDLVFV